MQLQSKTLEKLRNLINEETEYRSGPKLVSFFNNLGFRDIYQQGFPSRWIYTDDKLQKINGKPELDKCIKDLFAPVNFVGKYSILDQLIVDFNQYLAFDGWSVIWIGKEISFKKVSDIDFVITNQDTTEDEFLKKDFEEVSVKTLDLSEDIAEILEQRLDEIKKCLSSKSALATIILCGSALEGILLGIASKNSCLFNKATSSPKDKVTGKVLGFDKWTLSNFIDVAKEVGYIDDDTKKFSHVLRDFRNYIHPFQQNVSKFNPTEHTAKLCWQVLKLAIFQISNKIKQV